MIREFLDELEAEGRSLAYSKWQDLEADHNSLGGKHLAAAYGEYMSRLEQVLKGVAAEHGGTLNPHYDAAYNVVSLQVHKPRLWRQKKIADGSILHSWDPDEGDCITIAVQLAPSVQWASVHDKIFEAFASELRTEREALQAGQRYPKFEVEVSVVY